MLVLVDTPGFMPGSREEAAGIIGHGADMLRAFAGARTRRATVVVRKAFGGAFITMNSKDLGADAAFAWPQAEIGIMSPQAAVEILYGRRLQGAANRRARASLEQRYAAESISPASALRSGAIDAVIEPHETRDRVSEALGFGAAASSPGRSGRVEGLRRGAAPGPFARSGWAPSDQRRSIYEDEQREMTLR
jgi:acetyl-CoA carboxylase carboxyltransferase component